jgi:hypothetical protein
VAFATGASGVASGGALSATGGGAASGGIAIVVLVPRVAPR